MECQGILHLDIQCVPKCRFRNVWVCVFVGFVLCGCVYMWLCMCWFCNVRVCMGVCMCGFCNVWVSVCVGFVMCGCVYVWVL